MFLNLFLNPFIQTKGSLHSGGLSWGRNKRKKFLSRKKSKLAHDGDDILKSYKSGFIYGPFHPYARKLKADDCKNFGERKSE